MCPVTAQWSRSSRRAPCPLCGNDSEWCSTSPDGAIIKCRVVIDGSFRTGDDGGGEYHLHWADGKPTGARVVPPSPPPAPVAPIAERHRVYSALLDILALSTTHRRALTRRGLTPGDIDRAGYRTLPPVGDRAQVVKALRIALGGTIANDIPGLDYSCTTNPDVRLLGPAGVLIPVRDHQGQIQALKVRCDDPTRGKYLWLSSTSVDGPSSGAPCHLVAHPDAPHLTVRVTEGPLKADVATALSALSTIGIPGVTAYRSCLPVLRELGVHTVVLAWDADARKKTTHTNFVASSLESFALLLASEGIAVEVETWLCDDQHTPKGIDDALLAQAAITVHRGAESWCVIRDTLTAAGLKPKAETVARAGGDAVDSTSTTSDDDTAGWSATLSRSQSGAVKSTYGNVCKALRNAPEFKGKLRINTMTQGVEFEGEPMPEEQIGRIRERFEDASWGRFSPSKEVLFDAVRAVACEHRHHPVQAYLSGLTWDGTERIGRVVTEVLRCAAGNDLAEMLMRRWFVSAVVRAMDPGSKVDTALVLVGDQGWRKSSFFSTLSDPWFGDTEIKIGDKDGYQQIHANWITEWGEIDRVSSQRHAGDVKAFISRRKDLFRPPYARNAENFPRACVIVGSTNEGEFLNDPTGSRRFWVINVGARVNLELLASWRDQLWAEAVTLYRAHDRHWLEPDEDVQRERAAERHRIRDPWEDLVEAWLGEKWPKVSAERRRRYLTMNELVVGALDMKPKDCSRGVENRLGAVMRVLGYVSKVVRLKEIERAQYRDIFGEPKVRLRAWIPAALLNTPELKSSDEVEFEVPSGAEPPPSSHHADPVERDFEDGSWPC